MMIPGHVDGKQTLADGTTNPDAVMTRPDSPPVAVAIAATILPQLDGNILDDPAWRQAQSVGQLWQNTPDEGELASEKTDIRILYSDETIFFGVVCYDRDPGNIIVSESSRDARLDNTDAFQIILDTYKDGQNGFVFGTNPAGIEYDGQVTNEGQGMVIMGGQRGGSGGGFNINWDGSWEVHTSISEVGWSAEFAIPFRTLRYTEGAAQEWGLNFQRNIRRRNENAYWAPLPRQFKLHRLSLAGTLTNLTVPNHRNLQLLPYVLGSNSRDVDISADRWSQDGAIGFDLKYSLTPSLTLDLSYNTDFAQVEVDEQQINLNRFNLFFPEKRSFFLENAGLFSVGSSGEVELFFSRRIGIGPDGQEVPITGGGRITGKLGAVDVGLLSMSTESIAPMEDSDAVQANNFTVARVKRELANRSSLGAILVNRMGYGRLTPANDYNRTVAVDGRLGIGQYGLVESFVAKTTTPDLAGDDLAFKLGANYNSEKWRLALNLTDVGSHFTPEVGFLRRENFTSSEVLIYRTIRPQDFFGLHEIRPHTSYRGYWNHSNGFHQSGFWHIDNHWEWKSGSEIHTGVNLTHEGVEEPFEIYPLDSVMVSTGSYDHAEIQLVAFTNRAHWWWASFRLVAGGYFGGTRMAPSPSFGIRYGEKYNLSVSLRQNNIDLPAGSFQTNLIQVRTAYSFTPRTLIQALVQYNDRAARWSANVQLRWLQQANTGLFIVYNQGGDVDGAAGPIRNTTSRSLILKYTHLFDVFR